MATFLDLGVLNYFSVIFPALIVFVVVYMIFEKTKILGENKAMHAIIAIAAAFVVMLSRDILAIINFGAPWFVMVFVFLVLLIVIYRFMGASEGDLSWVIRNDKPVQWTIFAIGIIIIVASISHVYGQRLLEKTPGEVSVSANETAAEGTSYSKELYDTLFNPKVLGVLLIFAIATFTVTLLTRESF